MKKNPRELISPRQLAVRGQVADDVSSKRRAVAAALELARAQHHLAQTRARKPLSRRLAALGLLPLPTTKVKGLMSSFNRLSISGDVPSELAEQSDGVSDDGAMDEQIIGACACDAVGSGLMKHLSIHDGVAGGLQHIAVSGLGDLAIGGLGDLAIGGLPSYLFTRKNLSNPVMRRRLGAAIKAMTPKLRRRVMERLRTAASVARVSGQVRSAYPTVAGGGWQGISVSGIRRGGCPYANVAGALTP